MDYREGNPIGLFECILSRWFHFVGTNTFPAVNEKFENECTPPASADTMILSPGFTAVMPLTPLMPFATILNPFVRSWNTTCVNGRDRKATTLRQIPSTAT